MVVAAQILRGNKRNKRIKVYLAAHEAYRLSYLKEFMVLENDSHL